MIPDLLSSSAHNTNVLSIHFTFFFFNFSVFDTKNVPQIRASVFFKRSRNFPSSSLNNSWSGQGCDLVFLISVKYKEHGSISNTHLILLSCGLRQSRLGPHQCLDVPSQQLEPFCCLINASFVISWKAESTKCNPIRIFIGALGFEHRRVLISLFQFNKTRMLREDFTAMFKHPEWLIIDSPSVARTDPARCQLVG